MAAAYAPSLVRLDWMACAPSKYWPAPKSRSPPAVATFNVALAAEASAALSGAQPAWVTTPPSTRSPAARAVYRAAGALVDEDTQLVRLGRDIVEAQMGRAPERFVLHARNPERHLHVGGNVVNFGPVHGAPNISDRERGRRYGDLEGFRDILKLTHALGILHWQGGIVVEPVDVPVAIRHLATYQAHIECADIVWAARGVGGVQAEDALAMSAIEHG